MHRIFIVEDHAVVRESYAAMIEDEPDLALCGMAGSATEALSAIPRLDPALVLLDLSLPDRSGFSLLNELRAAGWAGAVLVVSGHPRAQYEARAREGGASGYVDKMNAHVALIPAMRAVLEDGGSSRD